MRPVTSLGAPVALLCAALLLWPGSAPAQADLSSWKPDVAAARDFAEARSGAVSFAVRTPERAYGYAADRSQRSASVVKVMLLTAYLRRPGVRSRGLRASDRALLDPMIRRSDNRTANRVFTIVGTPGLQEVARAAGMRRFVSGGGSWGSSRITARDQARFLLRIDARLPPRHRAYGMRLLQTIVPSQRWGIAKARPEGWTLAFKGGWGSGTGLVDHQVAQLRLGPDRIGIAILTAGNPSQAYGTATIQGVAKRLLRDLEPPLDGAVPEGFEAGLGR